MKKKRNAKLVTRILSAFLALCMVLCNTGFLSLASSIDAGEEDLVTIRAAACENGHLMVNSRVQDETTVLAGETVLVEPIADEGYMENTVIIQNDNGDVIAYDVFKIILENKVFFLKRKRKLSNIKENQRRK